MAAVTSEERKSFKVTLDLTSQEARDLSDSIYESVGWVRDDNWRSDPRILLQLREELDALIGR